MEWAALVAIVSDFQADWQLPRPMAGRTLCNLSQLHLQPPYSISHAFNLFVCILVGSPQLFKLFLVVGIHGLYSLDEGLQSVFQSI